jgi:hypothetical protein
MSKMMMNPADVRVIAEIIKENNITGNFDLVYEDTSGIGYCIDLVYETEVNSRSAKVTIPVCGTENW